MHTKSIVATSEAVVKCGSPAFGFGTLPTAWNPLSIVKRIALLCIPSAIFSMPIHVRGPLLAASAARIAKRASSSTSKRMCLLANSLASSVRNRPRVNRKRVPSCAIRSDSEGGLVVVSCRAWAVIISRAGWYWILKGRLSEQCELSANL
jgi:hypothetical protein